MASSDGASTAHRTPLASHLTSHLTHLTHVTRLTPTRYATLWMALGLPEGGKVVTCERDERAAEVARRNFASAGAAVE